MFLTIQKFIKRKKIHIVAWASFIIYETLIIGFATQKFSEIGDYIIHYSYNICFFYFHAHVTLYHVFRFKNRKTVYWILPLATLLEIILYTSLLYVINLTASTFPYITGISEVVFNKSFILKSVWRSLYFVGFSSGYYFLITFLKEKEHTTELERQRLNQIIGQQKMEQELAKAQNAYLRAQINPHFLFNTLNFIYNKTRKSAPIAADAILTLSAMMRYAIEAGEDKGNILIEEEIEQVHNLIHLHRLRQNDQIYFEIVAQNDVKKIRIIPLILITLVENIFKHGNLSLKHHPAIIKVYMLDAKLYIETDNLINAIHNKTGFSKGLENIEKRLKNAYGNAATFEHEADARNHFKTQVMINVETLHAFALPIDILDDTGK
ncbi:sensor histidine kinase [Olivibacter sp. SDN3]|uniref:sensor histidine kinase n=1 Tax=Olivibacter sp. SDN3 TaxID=2764720 RepID=UPI0016517653|nr:sensor histidine kinase [Olivibacter sp. SDN3]QNL50832.1 sensor histidine kinase [Olivibacter sp. SDN3]